MIESSMVPLEEKEKILKSYTREGRIVNLPSNRKKREVVLEFASKIFEQGRQYNEREVNSILTNLYDDIFIIRRELVEYGFMCRTRDGRSYWLTKENHA